MELNIKNKEKNEVLKRQDIVAETTEKVTPSKAEVQEKLASLVNLPKEQVVVRKIETGFGKQGATVYAKAYDSEEALKEAENEYMVNRNQVKKEAPAEENEEKPSEEGKESPEGGKEKPKEVQEAGTEENKEGQSESGENESTGKSESGEEKKKEGEK